MLALAGLPLSLAACASAGPSKELLTARDAYAKARQSAGQLNPEGTRDVERALNAAERAHDDDAGSERERSRAYVATRKAELALAQAGEARARQDRERAQQVYQAGLERELSSLQRELRQRQAASDRASRERQGWRQRGDELVVTLSGVVFETGRHELSPDAKTRLDVVVHAAKQNPDRTLTVAGYTDTTGRGESNRELSQKRADEVKAYLEGQGVTSSRIVSVGRGESNPVASNETTEGRAENRRVEVSLERAEPPERVPVKGTDTEPTKPGKRRH